MLSRQMYGWAVSAMLLGSVPGCSPSAPPPPVDDTRGGMVRPAAPAMAPKTGVSTGQKVVLLAGAAALYYMYKHH